MITQTSGLAKLRRYISILGTLSVGIALLIPLHVLADPSPEPLANVAGSNQAALLSAEFLETNDAVIGVISIDNGSVFDLENPKENKWLFRLANTTHATTRPDEIRHQLLFKTGDRFSSRVLAESERILRGNRYLHEVTITPVRFEDGVVDVDVHTADTWSLVPKLNFSRKGGVNDTAIGLKEINLFGTGMQVALAYESDVDRDSTIIKIVDHHLGKSWYGLDVVYGDNSDGHTRILNLGRPFYSLETNLAGGLSYLDNDQIKSLYDHGELYGEYRQRAKSYEVFGGWSGGLASGWTRRYTTGLGYDEHQFASVDGSVAPASIVSEDRLFVYSFFGIELMQDKYEKGTNYDQIGRTEDRYLGTRVAARLGYASTSLGSDRNAWLVNAGAQTAFGTSKHSTLFLTANVGARWESDGLRNLLARMGAKYYKRQSKGRLFYASLDATYGQDLDIDNRVLLGGDNGLRGYPYRYLGGSKSALLTLEQRFFTDWYPFRLFRIGGAVFFDAGRTWGPSPAGSENPGLLKDIGFGLRIGNSRSGQGNMIHIDLAFPLDGDDSIDQVQFLIETRKSF